ncbi:hypothetical protein [Paraburkholderia phytofirmans]|uniref:hypothetical protein n=1 Tax=Paraburkholderia phytofirmans TaxID=261302 RepID=UPI0011DF7031|nr:hypothetical protein [Paraburkholderia phytofirmans]
MSALYTHIEPTNDPTFVWLRTSATPDPERKPAMLVASERRPADAAGRCADGGRNMLNVAGTCKPLVARYTERAAETTAHRFDSREFDGRATATVRFFYVRMPLHASSSGWVLGRASSDAQVSYRACLSTGSMTCPPRLTAGGRSLSKSIGGRLMRRIPTRPEQSQNLNQIINRALRDAAVEPTPNGAIDVLGGALIVIAELARSEARYAA